jgi:hypothetical protein
MWTDYGLSWDPKKYSGIEVIRLPHDLWMTKRVKMACVGQKRVFGGNNKKLIG